MKVAQKNADKKGARPSSRQTKLARLASEGALIEANLQDAPLLKSGTEQESRIEQAQSNATPEAETEPNGEVEAASAEETPVDEIPVSLDEPEDARIQAPHRVMTGDVESNQAMSTDVFASGDAAETAVDAETVAKAKISTGGETGAVVHGVRPGVLESPLARRMREEAEQRRLESGSRRKTRSVATGKHDRGPEFERADALVRDLTEQLRALEGHYPANANVNRQISDLRRQIRASRGVKVAGLQPFDDAIREARQALGDAKDRKRAFLADHGAAPDQAGARPSLRQQLRALRLQKREALEAAGGEIVSELRQAIKEAKAARRAARIAAPNAIPTPTNAENDAGSKAEDSETEAGGIGTGGENNNLESSDGHAREDGGDMADSGASEGAPEPETGEKEAQA